MTRSSGHQYYKTTFQEVKTSRKAARCQKRRLLTTSGAS